ncbi:hypothetical protein PCE1_003247 [Barthelona sp. PCE]
MPRSKPKITENFTFTNINNDIIVSSTNENINKQRSLCIIDINDKQSVSGPPINVSASGSKKVDMLRPTLLEPSIFHRTVKISRTNSLLELFEFHNNEFTYLKNYELPFHFDHGRMLDRRFLLYKSKKRKRKVHLNMYDLDQNCENSLVIAGRNLKFVVQSSVVFVCAYHMNGNRAVAMFSFTDEGEPLFVDHHPFLDELSAVEILDRTPGDNQLISIKGGEAISHRLVDNKFVTVPFPYVLPKGRNKMDIVRIFDSVVPLLYSNEWFPSVYSPYNNFVLLNGKVFCTEHDKQSGLTVFYQMNRRDVNCLFVLGIDAVPYWYSPTIRSLSKCPVIFSFMHNYITLLHPTNEFKHYNLHSAYRLYDSTTQQWRIGYVTETEQNVCCTIDDEQVCCFDKVENAVYNDIVFNRSHYVASYCDIDEEYNIQINDSNFEVMVDFLSLVDNYVWYIGNGNILTVHVLSDDGEIISTKEHTCDDYVWGMVPNFYCPFECCFVCGRKIFYVCCEDDTLRLVEIHMRMLNDGYCFIDRGLLVTNYQIFKCNAEDMTVESESKVTYIEGELYSPEKGVAAGFYKRIDAFQLKIPTLTFSEDNECCMEERTIDIEEFLADCSVYSFSSYGSCHE